MLLALYVIIFSISLMFMYAALLNYDPLGQNYAFVLLPIAAAETSLGLSLLVIIFKTTNKPTLVETL